MLMSILEQIDKSLHFFYMCIIYKMSGNPYISPLDPAKFREAYLATLGLQAKINAENLQANQVYKKTGAPTQPTDTRTTEQKETTWVY